MKATDELIVLVWIAFSDAVPSKKKANEIDLETDYVSSRKKCWKANNMGQ